MAVEILKGLGHTARYLAGAAVAGGIYLAEAAVVLGLMAFVAGMNGEAFVAIVVFIFGMIAAFVIGLLMVTFVLFPAVLIGEITARKTFWPAAPLVALVLLGGLTTAGSVIWTQVNGDPLADAVGLTLIALAASILPALAFGLVTYLAGWIAEKFPRIAALIRRLAAWAGRRFPRLAGFVKRLTASLSRRFPRITASLERQVTRLTTTTPADPHRPAEPAA